MQPCLAIETSKKGSNDKKPAAYGPNRIWTCFSIGEHTIYPNTWIDNKSFDWVNSLFLAADLPCLQRTFPSFAQHMWLARSNSGENLWHFSNPRRLFPEIPQVIGRWLLAATEIVPLTRTIHSPNPYFWRRHAYAPMLNEIVHQIFGTWKTC